MSKRKNKAAQPVEANNDAAAETPAAAPERDAKGRFTAGNQGGPGNPFGRRLASMRQAILRAVTEEDIERLMGVLLGLAMEGDVAAAKLVLQYAVGKPQAAAEPDRVEVDEWELQQKLSVPSEDIHMVANGMPIRVANVSMALLTPEKEKTVGKVFRGELPAEDEMTPEELEEIEVMKREWAAERAAEAMRAAPPGADGGPSLAGGNGTRPAADWASCGEAETASAGGSRSRRAS